MKNLYRYKINSVQYRIVNSTSNLPEFDMKLHKMLMLMPLMAFGTGCEAIQDNPYLSQFLPTVAFDGLRNRTFEEVDTEFLLPSIIQTYWY